MLERRALARHKTFIKGRIYFNNRLSSMDCIVRDVTDMGCRLEVSDFATLPETFELYMPNKDEYYQAHIKWRRATNVGASWTPETTINPRPESGRTDQHIGDRVAKLERELASLQKRIAALEN